MLAIDALTKRFGATTAVNRAVLDVAKGELLCLLGPSGCGKSTLLRMIAGLVPADEGRIRIDGQDMTATPANERPTAMVFQSHALWDHMSVAGNVGFGLRVRRLSRSEIDARVAAALDRVGLAGFGQRRPNQLSGGQAQRVALARCLVVEPKVLLMDEPFSALDAHLRQRLRDELKTLQRRLGLTTIFVTHDQEEAMELADRIVVMNAGRIEQVGTPRALYEAPATVFVAGFIGLMTLSESAVINGRFAWHGLDIPADVADGPVTVGVRAEDLAIGDTGVAGMVERIIDYGAVSRILLRTAARQMLSVQVPGGATIATDLPLRVVPKRGLLYRDSRLLTRFTVSPALAPEPIP